MMKIICGLGNPGRRFKFTRHNLGFLALDKFQKENCFPRFKFFEKFLAEISQKNFKGEQIVLLKPKTFMNDSGIALKKFFSQFKTEKKNLCLVHDDLDLPFGKIKISFQKSSGGHKGVQSVIDQLSANDFWRMRIGVGEKKKEYPEIFVLKEFNAKEKKALKKILNFANELLKIWIENPQKSQTLAPSFYLDFFAADPKKSFDNS
jgi:PTH1 family peptidyl-tRNA hydrolase